MVARQTAQLKERVGEVQAVADAAAKSQREAFDLVHSRVSANIEDVQRLLRK